MSLIERAIRNQMILAWYAAEGEHNQMLLQAEYADHLGCPLDEVLQEMDQPDDLDWLWNKYQQKIEDFAL